MTPSLLLGILSSLNSPSSLSLALPLDVASSALNSTTSHTLFEWGHMLQWLTTPLYARISQICKSNSIQLKDNPTHSHNLLPPLYSLSQWQVFLFLFLHSLHPTCSPMSLPSTPNLNLFSIYFLLCSQRMFPNFKSDQIIILLKIPLCFLIAVGCSLNSLAS